MTAMNVRTELRDAIASQALVRASSGARIIGGDEKSLDSWIFDFRALLLQPRWLDAYAEIFWETYKKEYPFQVCGMESAAISLVAAIVMKSVERGMPVNGLFMRKSRKRKGLLRQIEGTPNKEKIILVDDLINSGSTFKKQIDMLSRDHLSATHIFALLAFRPIEEYSALISQGISISHVFSLKDFGLPPVKNNQNMPIQNIFETLWHFKAPDPSYNIVVQKSAPAIDEDSIYFGSDSGAFYALEQRTGDVRWSFRIGKFPEGKGILSSPALYKDRVFFGAYDGTVYALNSLFGEVVWKYSDADWVGSSPYVAAKLGLVLIGLEYGLWNKRGGIVALNLETGAEVWRQKMPALTHCSPLYIEEENMVVIGSNNATIYAYQADTGLPLWHSPIVGDAKSSFAYDRQRRVILFGSVGGQFYVLSAQNGSPLFSKEITGGMYSTPVIGGNTVYITSLDKCVYALDMDTWKQLWVFETGGRIFATPVVIDGHVWIGSNDGKLYEIDASSGKLKSFFQATERIVNKISYNRKTGVYFVPTQANEIYSLRKIEADHKPRF